MGIENVDAFNERVIYRLEKNSRINQEEILSTYDLLNDGFDFLASLKTLFKPSETGKTMHIYK